MKVTRLHVEAYGALRDWSAELAPVTVLLGPNEAGKSTLRNLLAALLYGFSPANRDQHPYLPWDGDRLWFRAHLHLDAGGQAEVERRLMSSPQTTLTQNGQGVSLANRPLPWAGSVDAHAYAGVYNVGPTDLRFFSGNVWQALSGTLLGGAPGLGLAEPATVAAALEAEAAALWRPDERGKPRAKELTHHIKSLTAALREARKSDARRHEAEAEQQAVREELAAVRAERQVLRERRERRERLRHWQPRLEDLDRQRQRAGDEAVLATVPSDPAQALHDARAKLADLARRLEERQRQQAQAEAAAQLPESDRALLAAAAELRAAEQQAGRLPDLLLDRDRARQARQREEDALLAEAREWLSQPWDAEVAAALEGLALAALRGQTQQAERAYADRRQAMDDLRLEERAWQQARAAEGSARSPRPVGGGRPVVLLWAALVVAALGAALGLASAGSWAWGLAAGGLVVGVLGLWQSRSTSGSAEVPDAAEATGAHAAEPAPLQAAREAAAKAAQHADEAASKVRELVADVPVAAALLVEPGQDLWRALKSLCECTGRLRDCVRDEAAKQQQIDEVEGFIREQAAALEPVPGLGGGDAVPAGASTGLEGADAPPLGAPAGPRSVDAGGGAVLAERLAQRLAAAQERRAAADQAAADAARLADEVAGLQRERRDAQDDLDTLLQTLAKFADEPEAACLVVRDRRDAWGRVRLIEEQLEMEAGGESALRAEVVAALASGELPRNGTAREGEGSDGAPSDGAGAHVALREDELDAKESELEGRAGELRKELEQLAQAPSAADIDGERAAFELERQEVARSRDRLALLAAIVRTAERRFRDAHEPGVLRRAGQHLADFTDGRYVRLSFDDIAAAEDRSGFAVGEAHPEGDRQGHNTLLVQAADEALPMPAAPPLSHGTLHQIHLALRLALADELDEGGERLPLCLDEVFAHWSGGRREAGLRHVAELAGRRQVLLFTCSESQAEEAERLAGARVVSLPGGS